ncbi:MAG: hypothetical protein ACTJG2_03780 [Candidatus Saccharimonadales bacterium]
MNDTGVKQQIVEGIKSADTILVTVGQNPSVDELSAALGVTLYLNDIGKHATAVVSGNIPPAITFLKPEKTFENSVDSLRDFVIALDKDKADHLRYKVEGDVVKIFITPYRTVITQKDLDYSQGDYNVEMVVAIGVKDKDHLDKALASHGRILHDASVATIGIKPSKLGSMDWSNAEASSLSELSFDLLDGLKDETKPMAERVASALLTGVVAATDRFSNDKTTANAMTISAKLMALGANQQLIAAKLREGSKLDFADGKGSAKIDRKPQDQSKKSGNDKKRKQDNKESLSITHSGNDKNDAAAKKADDTSNEDDKKGEKDSDVAPKETPQPKESTPPETEALQQPPETPTPQPTEEVESATLPPVAPMETPQPASPQDAPKDTSATLPQTDAPAALPSIPGLDAAPEESTSDALAQLDQLVGAPTNSANDASQLASDLATESANMPPFETPAMPEINTVKTPPSQQGNGPSFGGTLNATTQQAADDKRRNADSEQNKAILSHGSGKYVGDSQPMFESPLNGANIKAEPASVDPLAAPSMPTFSAPPLTPLETMAPAAVPELPAEQPETPATPPPPPTPDFSQLPPMPPQMPDFGQLPPAAPESNAPLAPEEPLGQMLPPPAETQAPTSSDPGQFKIPGQQ